jgi:hypothetical protein
MKHLGEVRIAGRLFDRRAFRFVRTEKWAAIRLFFGLERVASSHLVSRF